MRLIFHPDFFAFIYLIATILFIFGLKGLGSPRTALRGNRFAMMGMALALMITLFHPSVQSYRWIFYGILAGGIIGTGIAFKIHMTAMPQLVAALHSFVGLSATLVAIGTYFIHQNEVGSIKGIQALEISLGSAIGAITFTGSVIAFGKLQGLLSSNPLTFKGQHIFNLILGLSAIGLTLYFMQETVFWPLLLLTFIALLLGILLVIPIGGADMPVIVSMLNSYSGWAASATGFTLQNNLLIATGALVGA